MVPKRVRYLSAGCLFVNLDPSYFVLFEKSATLFVNLIDNLLGQLRLLQLHGAFITDVICFDNAMIV